MNALVAVLCLLLAPPSCPLYGPYRAEIVRIVDGDTLEMDIDRWPSLRARSPTPKPVAAETEDLKGFFEERAGILEHDAGLPRPEAELDAARIAATLARNRRYLWASLRSALAGYPALLSQVPSRPGPVDALPFGTATVHVREGAKPGPVSGSIVITEAEIEAARKAAPW